MTDLVNLGVRCTPEFRAALDAALKHLDYPGSRAEYVLLALVERLQRDGIADVPAPAAPYGVRKDARPDGWKSRLYADRYQLVAVWSLQDGFVFNHLHEYDIDPSRLFGTIRAEEVMPGDGIRVEISVLDVPPGLMQEQLAGQLRLSLGESGVLQQLGIDHASRD